MKIIHLFAVLAAISMVGFAQASFAVDGKIKTPDELCRVPSPPNNGDRVITLERVGTITARPPLPANIEIRDKSYPAPMEIMFPDETEVSLDVVRLESNAFGPEIIKSSNRARYAIGLPQFLGALAPLGENAATYADNTGRGTMYVLAFVSNNKGGYYKMSAAYEGKQWVVYPDPIGPEYCGELGMMILFPK